MKFGIKRKAAIAVATLGVAVAVLGGTQAAFAGTDPQPIDNLTSPGAYGSLNSADINWNTNKIGFTLPGRLSDNADDGHGPYLHVYASTRQNNGNTVSDGKFGSCDIHNVNGGGTSISTGDCQGVASTAIYALTVWVCNGGNSAGTGAVEGGCNGRVYFNPYVSDGASRASIGLGAHASTYGYSEIVT